MAVPAGKRSEGKLAVFVKATELTSYTIKITSNQKVFTPRYDVLTKRIVDSSIGIGQYIWNANDINVSNREDYEERRTLQKRAIEQCDVLLYNITLAKTMFHLSSKRTEYWSDMVREVKTMIRKWRDSDAKRYGHL